MDPELVVITEEVRHTVRETLAACEGDWEVEWSRSDGVRTGGYLDNILSANDGQVKRSDPIEIILNHETCGRRVRDIFVLTVQHLRREDVGPVEENEED